MLLSAKVENNLTTLLLDLLLNIQQDKPRMNMKNIALTVILLKGDDAIWHNNKRKDKFTVEHLIL